MVRRLLRAVVHRFRDLPDGKCSPHDKQHGSNPLLFLRKGLFKLGEQPLGLKERAPFFQRAHIHAPGPGRGLRQAEGTKSPARDNEPEGGKDDRPGRVLADRT